MFQRFISTSAEVLKQIKKPLESVAITTIPPVIAIECHKNIQEMRQLNASSLKDNLKERESLISSSVNAFMLSVSGLEFIDLICSGIWHNLTRYQQLMFTAGAVVYIGGATYSMLKFEVEQQTLAAGIVTGIAVGAAKTVGFFANQLNVQSPTENQDAISEEDNTHLLQINIKN